MQVLPNLLRQVSVARASEGHPLPAQVGLKGSRTAIMEMEQAGVESSEADQLSYGPIREAQP